VGAEIHVTVQDGNNAPRSIYRTVGQTSSFGASPMEQNIGLGCDARSVTVDVWWPASGTRQKFAGVEKNQYLEIREFGTSYTRLRRRPFRLGRSAPVTTAVAQKN
jgi:hypothetical protein